MLIKFGNHKLGNDTAIFNMGTAIDCPSRALGLCRTINQGVKCYAEKAEIQYKDPVINARRSQEAEWKSKSGPELLEQIANRIRSRRTDTRYLRYNESGDFYTQSDIEKLTYISNGINELGVTTYGYTARSDLDFSRAGFLCKGSGFDNPNLNGRTIVILKDEPVPEGYIECPGSCKKCNLCKIAVPHCVAFRKH
jgi:hypothetical protein